MSIQDIIDKEIKELWKNDIAEDYENNRLLKEDSLKNSFYYHLRRRLGDVFLDANNLRIFTEFNDGPLYGTGKRADIAVVKLSTKPINGYEKHLGKCIEDIYRDFQKLKDYIQHDNIHCMYYSGIIHEFPWARKQWLDKRSANNWANGRVTELVASYSETNEMEFCVFSYNGLNEEYNNF
ncbi:MAG: hypothetical protein ACI4S2_10905 [Lachnospiraceae bacterium]